MLTAPQTLYLYEFFNIINFIYYFLPFKRVLTIFCFFLNFCKFSHIHSHSHKISSKHKSIAKPSKLQKKVLTLVLTTDFPYNFVAFNDFWGVFIARTRFHSAPVKIGTGKAVKRLHYFLAQETFMAFKSLFLAFLPCEFITVSVNYSIADLNRSFMFIHLLILIGDIVTTA